jgi:uncharacterized Zn finger protein
MDRLASLFAVDVRARAQSYVGGENIQLLENNGEVLLATVSGTDRYLSAFRRTKRGIYYGCTCPFFTEGLVGCKHLWALVRVADQSELVRQASECGEFMPTADIAYGAPDERTEASTANSEGQESLAAQLARSLLIRAGS